MNIPQPSTPSFFKNGEIIGESYKNKNLCFFILKYGALFVKYPFSLDCVFKTRRNSDFVSPELVEGRILAAP